MVEVVATAPAMSLPILTLYFNTPQQNQNKLTFALPILPLHFVQPVTLSSQAILNFYQEYTFADNNSYYKLDDFIR